MELDSDRKKALQVGVLEVSLSFSAFFRFVAMSALVTCSDSM